ncbi:hypothetical protein BGZ63DRAFT_412256 [Mariannaea sp. PMI_226]|nr:hypothetical protein BGZ63DRAFT_412256 [Mariannaea sp. PMI_226]
MSHRSRGCLRCRQRRVKCDGGRPSCQRCVTRNERCVGYREESDLLFQDETNKVVLKSTSDSAASSSSPSASSSSSARTQRTRSRSVERLDTSSFQLPSSRSWLKGQSPMGKQHMSLDEQAASSFMDKYVIYPCNESSSPGFLEHLPSLFSEVNIQGRLALRYAVQAAGFADLSREHDDQCLSQRALEHYGEALNALGKSLGKKGKVPDDFDLMTVVILDIFETLFIPHAANVGSHTQGMAHILRLRGHTQFHDPRGWGLFRLAHHRLLKEQLAKQMPPFSESSLWLGSLNDELSVVHLEKDGLDISTICARANQILRDLNEGAIDYKMGVDLISEMISLDHKTTQWRARPEWSFRTLKKNEITGNQDIIGRFPDTIQLHRDIWMAYEWNYHRTARIILHQKLLACIAKVSSMPNTSRSVDTTKILGDVERSSLFQIEVLADEILATVPQSMGDINNLAVCIPDPSSPPRSQAIGAYFLLWPMKIVKAPGGMCTASQKASAQMVFERIRECTRMKTNLGGLSMI